MQLQRIPSDWPSREGAGVAAGVVIGLLCRGVVDRILRRFGWDSDIPEAAFDETDDEDDGSVAQGEFKMVLCVRTDLKMQKGKIAAQVGHGTLGAYKAAARKCPGVLRAWERSAQPKICLQIKSESEARRIDVAARRSGLVTSTIYDAGRTQIAAGTMTVLAVGPGPADVVNSVTGHLKLL